MKVSPSAVVNAIPNSRIESLVDQIISPLRTAMIKIVCAFVISPSPKTMLTLERSLFAAFLETGRNLLEMLLNSLEKTPEDQPVVIKHGKNNYRQIQDETVREVVTRFGKIKLTRSRYRCGRRGKLANRLSANRLSEGLRNFCNIPKSMAAASDKLAKQPGYPLPKKLLDFSGIPVRFRKRFSTIPYTRLIWFNLLSLLPLPRLLFRRRPIAAISANGGRFNGDFFVTQQHPSRAGKHDCRHRRAARWAQPAMIQAFFFMSIPRCEVVDPESIQILHVYNRCVRRSFLCGVDSVSGKDYSHRKQWIRDRLEFLTGIFAFDIATYAVMSNHFHLVLRSRPDIVAEWSDREIAIRTLRLQGKKWFRENGTPRKSTEAEIERITDDPEEVQRLRRRLSDLSKLMLYFDRNLAVRANREDGITGAFWEGEFKAELLLSHRSVLDCMAYVDLNPIRAKLAETLETSDFTGVCDRIAELRRELETGQLLTGDVEQPDISGDHPNPPVAEAVADEHCSMDIELEPGCHVSAPAEPSVPETELPAASASETNKPLPPLSEETVREWERQDQPRIGWLAPIQLDETQEGSDREPSGRRPSRRGFLSISLLQYLEVVEWAGRQLVPGKAGAISPDAPPILSQLGIEGQSLIQSIQRHAQRDRYFASTERNGIPEQPFAASPPRAG